jgi:hypothetical protein
LDGEEEEGRRFCKEWWEARAIARHTCTLRARAEERVDFGWDYRLARRCARALAPRFGGFPGKETRRCVAALGAN